MAALVPTQVLVLNAGSSTLKGSLFYLNSDLPLNHLPSDRIAPIWSETFEWTDKEHTIEVEQFLRQFRSKNPAFGENGSLAVVGHRIVHGGDVYQASTVLSDEHLRALEALEVLAPLHLPTNLTVLRAARAAFGEQVVHVGVFDTAFHALLPDLSKTFPIPWKWREQGIRRFGFHGISCQYANERVGKLLSQPTAELQTIVCHLGSGCSVTAVQNGVSVDTTMGFTPLDGVMMGSRSGALDPGVLVHLQREMKLSVEELDLMLNRESGLLGVSGVSSDIRKIRSAAEGGNVRAALALEIFAYSVAQGIARMAVALERVDGIAFTGGIGENDSGMRTRICKRLAVLGVRLDPSRNSAASEEDRIISVEGSPIRVVVIPAHEDWQVVRESCGVVGRVR